MEYLTENSATGCPMELFLFLVISLIFVTLLFSANALEHQWLNAYLSPFRLVLFIPIISLVDYLGISHCSFQSAPLHPDLPPPKKEWKKKKNRENKAKQVVFVLFIYYLGHGQSPSGHPSKERCIFVTPIRSLYCGKLLGVGLTLLRSGHHLARGSFILFSFFFF